MSVTCGFFNALNHDRLYDAIQMSSIFDGIIRDGIFSTIGNCMVVTAPEEGFFVNVGSGRAWFNHTWTLNDTDYPIEAEQAEVVLDRIDAVVLEVNSGVEVRNNTIKFIKGTPSSNPVKPSLTHNAEINQYALAYVRIRAGQTTIFQSDIENAVGTDETPYITGLLQQVSVENLILQWEAEFDEHFANWVATNEQEYQTWTTNMQAQYNAWVASKMTQYATWFAQMQQDMDDDFAVFDAWFQHMKDQLDSDAAGHLQAEIDALATQVEKGSIVTITTINSTLYNRTVTISQNGQSVSEHFDGSGVAYFANVPFIGDVMIEATDGVQTARASLNIPYFGIYSQPIAFWAATINITTTSPEFYSETINVARDGVIIGSTAFDATGHCVYTATAVGSYTFTVNYEGTDFDTTVNVTQEITYNAVLNAWTATLAIETQLTTLYSRTITIKKGGVTVGTTTFDNTGHATYKVHETGTYAVSSTDSGGDTYTENVTVTAETSYSVSLGLPNGSTALPTDDIQTWLKCAAITDKNYTTLAQVLNDSATYNRLLGDSNSVAYMVRSTTWSGTGRGLIPTMTSNTTPSGEAFAISEYGSRLAWNAFDGNADISSSSYWNSNNTDANGVWLAYDFGSAVRAQKASIVFGGANYTVSSATFKFQATNDKNGTWTDVSTSITDDFSAGTAKQYVLTTSSTYRYYRVILSAETVGTTYKGMVCELQFYANVSGIADDSNAMTTLGRYDYACSALLANATWAEAIANSPYMEAVLNVKVPIMSDNTTPSGQAFASSISGNTDTYRPYRAFDSNDEQGWLSTADQANNSFVGYTFTSAVNIRHIFVKNLNSTGLIPGSITIKATNDNVTVDVYGNVTNSPNWVTLKTVSSISSLTNIIDLPDNTTPYKSYSVWFTISQSGQRYMQVGTIQFYGRANITGNCIHSAVNDTIYYVSGGSNVTLATTDGTGRGTVDWSQLTPGTYTLYSTVAKDPSNLSNPYTQTVVVTKTTTEIYLIPDGALYWWGWKDRNVVILSATTGYTTHPSYSPFYPGTFNVNSYTGKAPEPGNTGLGMLNSANISKAYCVATCEWMGISKNKYAVYGNDADHVMAASTNVGSTTELTNTLSGDSFYLYVASANNRQQTVYALWYE